VRWGIGFLDAQQKKLEHLAFFVVHPYVHTSIRFAKPPFAFTAHTDFSSDGSNRGFV
jgi:hypothetical protein